LLTARQSAFARPRLRARQLRFRHLSRLVFEHNRNIVPNRIRQAIGAAHEFRFRLVENKRSLADRANEYIK
jgi:hypothetical protein